MPATDLEYKARKFADTIQEILTGTVSSQARIRAVKRPAGLDHTESYTVGHDLNRKTLVSSSIPLVIGNKKPSVFLDLSYHLVLDDSGRNLMVQSSFFGVYADPEGQNVLCHFDYERNKPDGYPESHVQVQGTSPALQILAPDRPLGKLHFPVGGRRFRPCLEDVVEFLVVEKLVTPKESWQSVLDKHRDNFRRLQLRAAVRRDPETARDALSKLDAQL